MSTFIQSLPPDAHQKWLDCVTTVSKLPGLHAWFEEESAANARLVTRFYGTPETSISVSLTIAGATPSNATFALTHDAEHGLLLQRRGTSNIVVNINGGGLTAGASSAFPSNPNAPSLFVSPYVVTPQTASPVATQRCTFELRNFTTMVEVPVVVTPPSAALLLNAEPGGNVEPNAGPLSFQSDRSLDDVTLKAPAELQVKVGDLTAVIATVARGDAGCAQPILRLPQSKVQVRYLQPEYQLVASDPVTTSVKLDFYGLGAGDYTYGGGNIGCPPAGVGCGNMWHAQIILRDGGGEIPVASFDAVALAASQNTGHWYSCTDGLCGTNGDFTESADPHSPKCFGRSTCWVWRHEDDGHVAHDTFSVTYRRRVNKCVRNCPTNSSSLPPTH